jgi:hypothetical protein
MTASDPKKPTRRPKLEDLIVAMCAERGPGRSVSPMAIAKVFAEGRKGDDANPSTWARDVRSAAIGLARAGKIVIYRKGEPADPDDFRGVYRLGLPGESVETGDEEAQD